MGYITLIGFLIYLSVTMVVLLVYYLIHQKLQEGDKKSLILLIFGVAIPAVVVVASIITSEVTSEVGSEVTSEVKNLDFFLGVTLNSLGIMLGLGGLIFASLNKLERKVAKFRNEVEVKINHVGKELLDPSVVVSKSGYCPGGINYLQSSIKLIDDLSRSTDRSIKLNDVLDENDQRSIYQKIAEVKTEEIIKQLVEKEIRLRDNAFYKVWEDLVDVSQHYLSLCDLSMYSKISDQDVDFEWKGRWSKRLDREVEVLKKKIETSKLKYFDKVVVYSKRCLSSSSRDSAPCATGKCSVDACHSSITCMVKNILLRWKMEEKKMYKSGVKSNVGDSVDNLVWVVNKEDVSVLSDILFDAENFDKLNSTDLGFFGDKIIGEEFKIPIDEALKTVEKPYFSGKNVIYDFLYVLRGNEKLTQYAKNNVIKMLKDHTKTSHAA